VAEEIARGEIWLLEMRKPDHRRPVLVLSRPVLIELLHTVTVAAITSTARGSPTEVPVGVEEGLKHPSCANLANVHTVKKSDLRRYVGVVGRDKMQEVCRAIAVALGCD
jgi:mRNA interferase MazF